MEYNERLHVPLRWWVQGIMLIASFWLALVVAVPQFEALVWGLTALVVALMAGAFRAYGARVEVTDSTFRAGRACIELNHVGTVEHLDAQRTRAVAGVEADARALLVLRPYLKNSVKVEITDPNDPTPYWLVSTRHPQQLAEALQRARVSSTL